MSAKSGKDKDSRNPNISGQRHPPGQRTNLTANLTKSGKAKKFKRPPYPRKPGTKKA